MVRSKDTSKRQALASARVGLAESDEADDGDSSADQAKSVKTQPKTPTMTVVPDKPPNGQVIDDAPATEGDDETVLEGDHGPDVEDDGKGDDETSFGTVLEVDRAPDVEGDDETAFEVALDAANDQSLADPAPTTTIAVGGESSESNLFPRPASVSMDYLVDEAHFEPLAEAVRYILARPQVSIARPLPARIAVVSALPGEGVSTVSSVFTTVLSNDSGMETCRVDLSWKPGSKAGVYEVLVGSAKVDDVLEWNGSSATLHGGGVGANEQHRLARSQELEDLITSLSRQFKHVVLDLPALLGGSDGLAMMRLVDAYLLVVQHGVTTLQQVQMATSQLADTESLGSVLNQVRIRTPRPLSRWLG